MNFALLIRQPKLSYSTLRGKSKGCMGGQEIERSSEKSKDRVIASAAKQSLPEKEIASSLPAPRNDIFRPFLR
jgi:hypothetical protein